MTDRKLFLLDAMALIYRAYFALQKSPRITSSGVNTSAAFGFTNFLHELIKKEKPTHIAVCIDSQKPTFRHEEYENYKANRPPMPEEIASNLPFVKSIVKALNIPLIACEGYEADDIIGTIAVKAGSEDFEVFMVTPDKDFGQLVNDNIKIYKPPYGKTPAEIIGKEQVCEKYGLNNTLQMKDYLGLVGDTSDNIPGVNGVGPVAAKKLLAEYGSVENIVENIQNIKNPSLKTKMENNAQMAVFSKKLATIITDVPCDFSLSDFKLQQPDFAAVTKIFDELEFKTFAKRFFTDISTQQPDIFEPHISNVKPISTDNNTLFPLQDNSLDLFSITDKKDISNTPHEYKIEKTTEEIASLVEMLKKQDVISFKTVTTQQNENDCEIVGFAFSFETHKAYYVPCSQNYHETQSLLFKFSPIFEDTSKLIIGQNIKFDIVILKWYDIAIEAKLFDTMVAHYLINPETRHTIEFLADTYLDYNPMSIEPIMSKKGLDRSTLYNNETIKDYAVEMADITFQLYRILDLEIDKSGSRKLFVDVEMPLVQVLAAMEFEGVNVSKDVLQSYSSELGKEIYELEETIYEQAGEVFNINSPKQLGDILFTKLQISGKPKKTKTGSFSTGEDVLQKLQFSHPIVQNILDYRSLAKLKSTYIDPLPLLINPRTNRVHTSYNQSVVATGRLSSTNPNLQNIPIRTERGREIRKAFIARNDSYSIMSADYSQIELRLIAHISGDENMKAAFNAHKDIHTATAATIFNLDEQYVTPDMRRIAKTVNFGIIYGMSAFGLSERLHIGRKNASEIIEQYLSKYHGVKEYMENIVTFARKNGYVETVLKRRRYIKDINSKNSVIRGYAERNAINAPIQGSSADMIKIAMINVYKQLITGKLKTKMIMQVHDELVFEVYNSEIEVVKKIVVEEMQKAIPLSIPIEVGVGVGDNWLEAH
ncbi:MAG: DNA polymerase I [Bacteroidales bacterium]|nr:DNA polymerase I [Bacteroidales bacterium]MDD3914202.1 DNA polymerase I [Bacteroidales bacterium]